MGEFTFTSNTISLNKTVCIDKSTFTIYNTDVNRFVY